MSKHANRSRMDWVFYSNSIKSVKHFTKDKEGGVGGGCQGMGAPVKYRPNELLPVQKGAREIIYKVVYE